MDQNQRIIANRNKQTAINLFSGILALVVSACVSFFVTPYLVKEVGVEASGFANLANNFVTYASLLTLAINSMGSRFMSITYYNNDLERCKKYYSSIFVANLAVVLVLVVPATVMVFNIQNILDVSSANLLPVKIVFAISFANFFVGLFNSCLSIPLLVLNKNSITNLFSIANSLFKAAFLLVVFLCFPAQIYWTALAGFVFTILSFPFYLAIKRKFFKDVPFSFKAFGWRYVWELFKSGIWNAINQCGNILMSGLDLLLANVLISGTEMGVLSVAKTIPLVIVSLSTTINTNYSSKLIISYSVDSEEDFAKALEQSCRVSCHLVSVPIAVFCVFSFSFFNIWQPTLDPLKLAILAIMTISYFIPFTGTTALFNVFTAKNKLSFNALTYLGFAAASFLCTFLLVRFTTLGVYAVALVSSVFSIVRNLALIIPYYGKLMSKPLHYYYRFVLLSLLAFAIACAVSSVVLFALKPASWMMMVVAVFLSAVISYVTTFFVTYDAEQKSAVYGRIMKLWRK